MRSKGKEKEILRREKKTSSIDQSGPSLWLLNIVLLMPTALATSEVIPSRSPPGGRLWRQLASRGIDRGKETVQGVWIEEYCKPM
jgi:hypothetical protein